MTLPKFIITLNGVFRQYLLSIVVSDWCINTMTDTTKILMSAKN